MRPVLSAVVSLALLAAASTAHADRYVSLGVGKSDLGGDLGAMFDDTDAGAYRVTIGQRFGNFALEASLFGSDFQRVGAVDDPESTLSLGVDLKYHFFQTGPLSFYGKGGLTKTWLRADGMDHEGTGFELGAGAELGINLAVTQLAVFAELGRQQTELRSFAEPGIDGSINTAMVGVAVGF